MYFSIRKTPEAQGLTPDQIKQILKAVSPYMLKSPLGIVGICLIACFVSFGESLGGVIGGGIGGAIGGTLAQFCFTSAIRPHFAEERARLFPSPVPPPQL